MRNARVFLRPVKELVRSGCVGATKCHGFESRRSSCGLRAFTIHPNPASLVLGLRGLLLLLLLQCKINDWMCRGLAWIVTCETTSELTTCYGPQPVVNCRVL